MTTHQCGSCGKALTTDSPPCRCREMPARKQCDIYRAALVRISSGMPDIRATRRFSEARLIAASALTGDLT